MKVAFHMADYPARQQNRGGGARDRGMREMAAAKQCISKLNAERDHVKHGGDEQASSRSEVFKCDGTKPNEQITEEECIPAEATP